MVYYVCNHCGQELSGNNTLEGCGWIVITNKVYCNDCRILLVRTILEDSDVI